MALVKFTLPFDALWSPRKTAWRLQGGVHGVR